MASSGNSLSIHSRVDVGRLPPLVPHWEREILTGVDPRGLYENHFPASTGKTMTKKRHRARRVHTLGLPFAGSPVVHEHR
jgi:hypothetical protein